MAIGCLIHLRHRLAVLAAEEHAVAATEYAILLSLLVLGSMGVIMSIGSSFRGLYTAIASAIPAVG